MIGGFMNNDTIVEVNNLKTFFYTDKRCNKALNGVSFKVRRGKTLCIVGESGCGKSVTAASIMGLLPKLSRIEEGEILYHRDSGLVKIDELNQDGSEMRSIRGGEIAMIFQDPMTALNPVFKVGDQIAENIIYHSNKSKKEAGKMAVELLKAMGIPSPSQRAKEYPHQFSGGMRQRAMIAMAMSCNPQVLIADEPTTALDVTIQAQIFELMNNLKREYNTAIMLITHDMGVVSELADDVAVMYMGNIVESGTVEDILKDPIHPYTRALLSSIPVLGLGKSQDLEPIKGSTPDPLNRPKGCQFSPRCDFSTELCSSIPKYTELSDTHRVMCWHYSEVK